MFKLGDPRTKHDPEAVVVSETVSINAPASLVWEILLDMPKYGDWNPFCFENTEYVCHFEPEKQISWMLPHYDYWPYPARRDQFIKSTGPKSCEYYSTDEFRGPNGIHVMRFAGPWVKQAFDDTAHALKAHAEKLYAES